MTAYASLQTFIINNTLKVTLFLITISEWDDEKTDKNDR